MPPNSPSKKLISGLEQQLIGRCDHVITVNPLMANELAVRYGISKPTVILNATNPEPGFDPHVRHQRLRESFGLDEKVKLLLYQGWFSWFRGLKELVLCLPLVPEHIHLVFMGYGDFKADLINTAQAEKVAHRVHFRDAVPQSELLFWTASADAGIIPYQPVDRNTVLCSPNKLFEYIQARLPVICNDLPFLRSIVHEQRIGIVKALTDKQAYAAAVSDMFDVPQGGPERFGPALDAIAEQYSWTNEEPKLLAIYDRLAKRSTPENQGRLELALGHLHISQSFC